MAVWPAGNGASATEPCRPCWPASGGASVVRDAVRRWCFARRSLRVGRRVLWPGSPERSMRARGGGGAWWSASGVGPIRGGCVAMSPGRRARGWRASLAAKPPPPSPWPASPGQYRRPYGASRVPRPASGFESRTRLASASAITPAILIVADNAGLDGLDTK